MSFYLANAKRQGANRLATTTTQNVKAAPSFAVARRALFEILSQYCFGKIIELVEMPATDTRLSFFHGKVLIVNNSYFTTTSNANTRNQNQNQSKPEQLFFDKAGRQKSMISIGPMKLIDTVYGHGHKNSVPQLGEILIGLKVENTNEKRSKTQPYIFRSWSMNGKVMLDLFRMVQYGTKMSDLEIRPMFRQGAGAVAQKMIDASKDSLPFEQKVSMCKCVKAVDDIYIVAKLTLWGNMRLLTVLHCLQTDSTLKQNQTATEAEIDAASDLKLSANALEFVQGISQKLNDDSIMKHFTDCFSKFSGSDKDKEKEAPPWKPYVYDYGYGVSTKIDQVQPSSPVYGGGEGGAASPYAPSSPVYGGGAASPFAPSSPMYGGVENGGGAASPMYGRTSPVHDKEKEIKIKKIDQDITEEQSESNSPLAPPPDMSDSEEEEDAESPIEPPPSDTADIESKPSKKKSRWGDATVSQILENSLH